MSTISGGEFGFVGKNSIYMQFVAFKCLLYANTSWILVSWTGCEDTEHQVPFYDF